MTFPVSPSRARCTSTTKLFTSPDPFTLAPSPPPSSLNLFTIRSNNKAEVNVSLQSTHTNCAVMDSRKARVMVRFPLAGKPVRHIAGGLGKEEWPRTEERAENCGSRQGYVIVRSSMVGTTSMVIVFVDLIQSRFASKRGLRGSRSQIVANCWRPTSWYHGKAI